MATVGTTAPVLVKVTGFGYPMTALNIADFNFATPLFCFRNSLASVLDFLVATGDRLFFVRWLYCDTCRPPRCLSFDKSKVEISIASRLGPLCSSVLSLFTTSPPISDVAFSGLTCGDPYDRLVLSCWITKLRERGFA